MQHLVLYAYGNEEVLCMHGQLLSKCWYLEEFCLILTRNGVGNNGLLQPLNCDGGYH